MAYLMPANLRNRAVPVGIPRKRSHRREVVLLRSLSGRCREENPRCNRLRARSAAACGHRVARLLTKKRACRPFHRDRAKRATYTFRGPAQTCSGPVWSRGGVARCLLQPTILARRHVVLL